LPQLPRHEGQTHLVADAACLDLCPPRLIQRPDSGRVAPDDDARLSQPPAGYPLTFPADGLLVDDPGHPHDLISAVRSVFEVVFDDPDAFYRKYGVNARGMKGWLYRNVMRKSMNRRVRAIRMTRAPAESVNN
jgi:hypothetical protein